MIDYITSQPSLPEWHWHAEWMDRTPGNMGEKTIDQGWWRAEAPQDLAHFLGWQLTDMDVNEWTVSLWHGRCEGMTPSLVYTTVDHHNWLRAPSTNNGEIRALKQAMAQLRAPVASGDEASTQPGLLVGADRPAPNPFEEVTVTPLDFGSDPADVLRYFESLLSESGRPDPQKVLAMTGDRLAHAMVHAARHANDNHPGEPWVVSEESVERVARAAAVFLAAVLGRKFGQ